MQVADAAENFDELNRHFDDRAMSLLKKNPIDDRQIEIESLSYNHPQEPVNFMHNPSKNMVCIFLQF